MKKKSDNVLSKIPIKYQLVLLLVCIASILIISALNKPNSANSTGDTSNTSQHEVPKASKSNVADKVSAAINKLDKETKSSLASTGDGGYLGDIVGVEPAVSDDTAKVKVSTQFPKPAAGKPIATKILAAICRDIPELDSVYVTSGTGLDSTSAYRREIPSCNQQLTSPLTIH